MCLLGICGVNVFLYLNYLSSYVLMHYLFYCNGFLSHKLYSHVCVCVCCAIWPRCYICRINYILHGHKEEEEEEEIEARKQFGLFTISILKESSTLAGLWTLSFSIKLVGYFEHSKTIQIYIFFVLVSVLGTKLEESSSAILTCISLLA